jgi:hypothetical protein
MYSDLIRAPQSILFGFPLIRQVLYLLSTFCKGNHTNLRRILHLSLAKGNPK